MNRSTAVEIVAIPGVPLVRKDDDLVALIGEGLARGGIVPRGGDVFVLTQKIVSKAEGRVVDLATVEPSTEAIELAGKVQKDPRLVELILSESVRVVRARPGVLIVEHRPGFVMANAGIDQSNLASPDDPQQALLLPVDPDGSAEILRRRLSLKFGVDLATVAPSREAIELAGQVQKDPRLVELILSESVRVVRARPGLLIVEHRLGFVVANAGVDQSNVASPDEPQRALLLPVDPDGSAEILRRRLSQGFGVPVAVIINDSFGRAWRRGTCGVAIGAAGLPSLMDLRGSPDLFGRELQVSITGHADEIAAAASLVMGQGAEGQPVVVVRGLTWQGPDNNASELVRPAAEDMFR